MRSLVLQFCAVCCLVILFFFYTVVCHLTICVFCGPTPGLRGLETGAWVGPVCGSPAGGAAAAGGGRDGVRRGGVRGAAGRHPAAHKVLRGPRSGWLSVLRACLACGVCFCQACGCCTYALPSEVVVFFLGLDNQCFFHLGRICLNFHTSPQSVAT